MNHVIECLRINDLLCEKKAGQWQEREAGVKTSLCLRVYRTVLVVFLCYTCLTV